MGSARFPGKTLYPINGKPVIEYLLDSLKQLEAIPVIIATSEAPKDDEIYNYCIMKKIRCYRGSETNVASRFYNIVNQMQPDYFIRICADSPLLDHRIVSNAINYADNGYDIVSTVPSQSYPSGMNVEMIKSSVYTTAYQYFSTTEHFEHVTKYLYQNNNLFSIKPLSFESQNYSSLKFSFDTKEDLDKIASLLKILKKPHYEYSLSEKCEIFSSIQGGNLC